MTFGSLFAGIGGFDLGFERAGLTCKWQVEIDPYCQRVLAKHWPNVRRQDDVRTFPPTDADDWRVDVICGGFPCQDISDAGKRAGIDGERSGLWREYARVVRLLRPQYVVVENVAALLDNGMGRVLGDLASLGFDAEWEVLPACAFTAPHSRERVFIIANANRRELQASGANQVEGRTADVRFDGVGEARRLGSWWSVEPEPCSVAYGLSGVVDELSPYGNAVVPQVAEWIGRQLMQLAAPAQSGAP